MIRPSNIDAENHTADFKCDEHDAYRIALDLNTVAQYVDDEQANHIAIRVDSTMLDAGTELAQCNHASFFPVVGGNQDAQDLAIAKTV